MIRYYILSNDSLLTRQLNVYNISYENYQSNYYKMYIHIVKRKIIFNQ